MKFKKYLALLLISALFLSSAKSADAATLSYGKNVLPTVKKISGSPLNYNDELPSSYKTPLLTSVKDQGIGGLCWTFSALGGLEAYLLNNGYGEYDLSEKHMDLWATDDGSGSGWSGRESGDGGWAEISCGYLASWQGPVSESAVPYNSVSLPSEMDPLVGVTGIKMLDNNRDEIKKAIMEYSAVCASYNSTSLGDNGNYTAFYSTEVASPEDGHAICIVGWDDNYSKDNFGKPLASKPLKPKNDGAWLAKNSWGSDYNSNGGYFWISYEDFYLFNSDYGKTFAFTSVEELDKGKTLYQVETYGATYKYPVKEDHGFETSNCTFANIFEFDQRFPVVDKVVFYTESVGASYTIFYIPVEDGKLNTDMNSWRGLSSGVVPYSGYICEDIDDFTIRGDEGAVGIQLLDPDGDPVAIGVDEWMSDETGETYYFYPNAQKGISYLIDSRDCRDIMDIYKNNGDELGGLISIKLIAKAEGYTPPQYMSGDVNRDGDITMLDVVTVQKYIAKMLVLNDIQLTCADADNNADINMNDVVHIQKIIAELV